MRNGLTSPNSKVKGSALMLILIVIGLATALLVSALKTNPQIERNKIVADALAKAKDALIGNAITYGDDATHPDDVFGYFPCPDVNNDGTADANQGSTNCAGKDIPVVGRLPWKTLGLPPLRDSNGECLWYAVSGTFKAVAGGNLTDFMNWDTLGQFAIQDTGGSNLSGATAHNRPIAAIFSPGTPLGTQNRPPNSGQACSGDITNSVPAYLDGGNAFTIPTPAPVLLTAGAIGNATVNDRLLWISPSEIFDRIKQRSDFKTDIDTMISDLAVCLNAMASTSLPLASAANKGIDNVIAACPAVGTPKINVLKNWQDNLLYAKLATPTEITINGTPTSNACSAVLLFGGERATRTVAPLVAQTRATVAEKNDAAMYLEGVNATSFPGGTAYSGISAYTATSASADVVACITGTGGGGTVVSFSDPSKFSKFEIAGVGVTIDTTTDPENPTATIDVAGGSGGGCFWFPDTMTLNGKVLRSYYEFKFIYPDPPGSSDFGYGVTLSFLQGDAGKPTTCGSQSTMGVIPASTLPFSLFVETDIHQGGNGVGEPNGTPNHTAIMANGNTVHSASNGNLTTACNGTAAGCNYSLSNKFEESPATLLHNQRIEIHSGYNSTCTTTGGAYSLVKAWVDCIGCNNTVGNFTGSAPTVTRCISLDSSMNNIYFGFTAGFASSGGQVQGVTIQKLELRVE